MKTIELSTKITQNSNASKVLGHPGKDFKVGTFIDVQDNLPNILRALNVGFSELEYFSYNLIQLRAKQIPESKFTVHTNGTAPRKTAKNLIYTAQPEPKTVDAVVGLLLKKLHPCRNCGEFIPLPKRTNSEGGFYKRDALCRSCADIVIM